MASGTRGSLTEDNVLHISEGSTALHYGQQCFEGLKAYRCKDGSINLFRPDQNAARMQRSCARLLMPHVSTEQFIEACKEVVTRQRAFHSALRHRRRAVPASVRDRHRRQHRRAYRTRVHLLDRSAFRSAPTSRAA